MIHIIQTDRDVIINEEQMIHNIRMVRDVNYLISITTWIIMIAFLKNYIMERRLYELRDERNERK